MTKQQALFYCKEKVEYEEWVCHTMLLDIYDDDEEIAQDVLNLICYPPERDFHPYVMFMGKRLAEHIEMVSMQYLLLEQAKGSMNKN